MTQALSRSLDTLLAWAVAAALLSWPHLAARWRTALAVMASVAGVVFLMLAVTTEGLRETPRTPCYCWGMAT